MAKKRTPLKRPKKVDTAQGILKTRKDDVIMTHQQGQPLFDISKSIGVVAGFGSGKSHLGMIKCFDSLFRFPGVPVCYAAPTYPLISDIFYPAVEKHCREHGIAYNINRGRNVINLPYLGNILCRSISNPDMIIGWEAGLIVPDEFDLLPTETAKQVWKKLKGRLRYKYPKIPKKDRDRYQGLKRWPNQMFAISTPEGFKAFYDLFKREPIPGSSLHHMTTYANIRNLPEGYIEEMMQNYPPEMVMAYIMGQFTNMRTGRVWKSYDRKDNRSNHVVMGKEPLIVGMDFNVGRGCAIVYGERFSRSIRQEVDIVEKIRHGFYRKANIVEPHLKLVGMDEVFNSFDTPDTIRVLKERYPGNPITVIPDASGKSRKSINATQSDISLLKENGFRVLVNNSNPNIKDRVTAMNTRLCNMVGERNLYINDKRCHHFADGLEQQSYDENGMPEKGIGKFDDLTDAGTYPVAKLYPVRKINSQTKELIL